MKIESELGQARFFMGAVHLNREKSLERDAKDFSRMEIAAAP